MMQRPKQIASIALGAALSMVSISQILAQDPAIAFPINNWSYVGNSSTATEGYLRGVAANTAAAGNFNYLTSLAEINRAEAVRRAIENEKAYIKTYFEIKEIRAQYWDRYRPRPPSPEIRRLAAELARPDQLTDVQFNRSSGKLIWPHILRQDEYAALRERVDELFQSRTADASGDGSPNEREIANLLDAMHKLLVQNVKSVTPQQFSDANAFIRSAAYEARIATTKSISPPIPVTVNSTEKDKP